MTIDAKDVFLLFMHGTTENGEKILVDIDRMPCFSTFCHNVPFV
jgi:hypothetical protein